MKSQLLLSTFLFIVTLSFAQKVIPLHKQRPTFITTSVGVNIASFKDGATSPLRYTGIGRRFCVGTLRFDSTREVASAISLNNGNFVSTVGKEVTQSKVNTLFLNYGRLYQVKALCTPRINMKLGVVADITGNLRVNESLQNNGIGIEMFNTLFAAAKATTDVSRKIEKRKKFLFIKYTLQPRKRSLSYQLNMAVMNNTLRNGYAYSNASSISNNSQLFYQYEYNVFSGYRMQSYLHYDLYYANQNAIRLSYMWDAYRSGGALPKFEMAHHFISVSLLFNIK